MRGWPAGGAPAHSGCEPGADIVSAVVVLGIPVALAAAFVLALGAQFQNRGVATVDDQSEGDADSGFSPRQLLSLARTPRWLAGTSLLVLAVILQLISLFLAPLPVVQPLGVLSLVITALLNKRMNHAVIGGKAIRAIGLCVLGVTIFVITAAFTTKSSPDGVGQVIPVLVIVGAVIVVFGAAFLTLRKRMSSAVFAIGAGGLFGCVATLAKIIIDRLQSAVGAGSVFTPQLWFTALCLLVLVVAGSFGAYLVQTAYSSGSPDLVVAALTVIDPIVAVTIGIVVLGEATTAPAWVFVVFGVAGALAVIGVLQLSRHQPEPADDRADTPDPMARQ